MKSTPPISSDLNGGAATAAHTNGTIYSDKCRIDYSTLNSLESVQRLNWWVELSFCRKLWPLSTTGNGNCLLNAASLAIWDYQDRQLTLRATLHGELSTGDHKDAIWRRWRFQQLQVNKQEGCVFASEEWAKEWDELVCLASPEPIGNNATYQSLEEIHIFALSHVLRRTIIVIADTLLRDMNGQAMAPIRFGGIYLPFEIPPIECNRAPLLLTYDKAHFSALVAMGDASEQLPALIPLIDFKNVLLPIQFCTDPGRDFNWAKLDDCEQNRALTDKEHIAQLTDYLDIVYAGPLGSKKGTQSIMCAQLQAKVYGYQEEIIKNYICAHDRISDTQKAQELREIEHHHTNGTGQSNGSGSGSVFGNRKENEQHLILEKVLFPYVS